MILDYNVNSKEFVANNIPSITKGMEKICKTTSVFISTMYKIMLSLYKYVLREVHSYELKNEI